MKMLEWDHSFLMFCRIGLCVSWKMFFFQANGVAGFGVLNLLALICFLRDAALYDWYPKTFYYCFLLFCVTYCSWPHHNSCDLVGSIIIITFLIYMLGFCLNRVSTVPPFPLFLALETQYCSLYSGRSEGIENTAIGKLTFIRKVAQIHTKREREREQEGALKGRPNKGHKHGIAALVRWCRHSSGENISRYLWSQRRGEEEARQTASSSHSLSVGPFPSCSQVSKWASFEDCFCSHAWVVGCRNFLGSNE